MILKSLREKSNQKHINKLLSQRTTGVSDSKIDSIGVVLNASEFNDFEAFREFGKALNVHVNKIKIIAFTEDIEDAGVYSELVFSKKDIGWKAKIKNPDLEAFINKEFDALVSFYNEEHLELNLITAISKANFKIGIWGHDARLFDFILQTDSSNFDVFKSELIKYLNILNKIQE